MKLSRAKLCEFLNKLSMILLCMLMVDVCVFGHLQLFNVGPFGNRMMLLFSLVIVSIPQLIADFKNIIKNKFVIILLAFAAWLGFSAVLGIMNKNSTNILISDVKGFFYFIFIPVALCVLNTKKRVHTLMKVLMYATLAVSLVYIAYLIIYLSSPKMFNALLVFGLKTTFSIIGGVTSKIPRIFIANVMYLLCGFAFPLYFYIKEENISKLNAVLYPIISGLSIFAMMITYTRSVYLGAALTVIGCVLIFLIKAPVKAVKRLFTYLISSIVVFGIILLSFSISQKTNYLSFALTRTLVTFSDSQGSDIDDITDNETDDEINNYLEQTIASDNIRKDTMNELLENIKESPIIGNGLGKGLMVRDNGEGLNEYFYLDVLSKMGIIGLLLYTLPVIYMIIASLFKRDKRHRLASVWLFVLLGFMSFSFFNPYMNASLGILMYCCTMAVFETCSKETQN